MDEMLGKSRRGALKRGNLTGRSVSCLSMTKISLMFPEGSCNFFADPSYTYM